MPANPEEPPERRIRRERMTAERLEEIRKRVWGKKYKVLGQDIDADIEAIHADIEAIVITPQLEAVAESKHTARGPARPTKQLIGPTSEKERQQRIAAYFAENYMQGQRLVPPSEAPGKTGDWKEWKNERLRNLHFYDVFGKRTSDIEAAPPRIVLRDSRHCISGHFEFKAWVQDKVEQVAAGEASPRFLSTEERNEEREEALDAWLGLSSHIEQLLEDQLLSNAKIVEGRQLALIRKITGRLEPGLNDYIREQAFHGDPPTDRAGLAKVRDRINILGMISNEVARSLIANSFDSIVSPEAVYWWESRRDEGRALFEFAKQNGCLVTEKQVRESILAGFQDDDGGLDEGRLEQHLSNKGISRTQLRQQQRVRLTIEALVEKEVEPKREWKRVDVWSAGIKVIPDLSRRIKGHIEKHAAKAHEICDNERKRSEAGLDNDEFGLSKREKRDLERLREKGYGNTQGSRKTPGQWNEHNSLIVTYNIINILKGDGLLIPRKMTSQEYLGYFLDNDESLETNRRGKEWPNLLVFTKKLKEIITKSGPEDFESGKQNAVYRWLRGERGRWMYCPPNQHTVIGVHRSAGGLLRDGKVSTNTSDYEMFEVPERDWFTGQQLEDLDDEAKMAKTVKCEPGANVMRAMNALQETQWEINLDLLQVICDFELDSGQVLEGALGQKDERIRKIRPKRHFQDAFYDDEDRKSKDTRGTVLEWCRRIIEHNANVFWHSWVCDFRGRMLPRCAKLSPQGDDLDRALIRFKEWKALGEQGRDWLHVHLHNLMEGVESELWKKKGHLSNCHCCGPARKNQTFENRRQWVEDNLKQLRSIGRRPQEHLGLLGLERRRLGKRTDFQRLAVLIELDRVWTEYEDSGGDWSRVTSGQPVYLDASCNGYQHVSALLRDPILASLSNLTHTDEGPQDLYQAVADAARNDSGSDVRGFLEGIGLDEELVTIAMDRLFSRSVAKQPTIVRVYGGNDIEKCLQGRNGRGRPTRSPPIPKTLTDKQKEDKRKIAYEFKEAYQEWKESKGDLPRTHYRKHAKKLRGKGFSKTRANKWERLLREESPVNLWAPGSSLHDAFIEPGGGLREFFELDEERPETSHWKEQPRLTELMGDVLRKSIAAATEGAYDRMESSLKSVTAQCDGLWPGVTWRVTPEDEGGGFRVHQYYIARQGAEVTKRGKPCYLSAAFSGLVPKWYKADSWNGHNSPKSKGRITIRVIELYGRDKRVPMGLRSSLNKIAKRILDGEKRVGFNEDLVNRVLNAADPKKEDAQANEIRPLLLHRDFSIPNYNPIEEKRINKGKISSAMPPNFVHSLDAHHMRTVINELCLEMRSALEHLSFWAVHDAFGTHPCDVERMRGVVIRSFKKMHIERNLNDWTNKMEWVGREMRQDGTAKGVTRVEIGTLWEDDTAPSEYLIS